jgi:murein DD-endopeptidase MepM/ murein hydrolase activator NlpD
VHDTVPLRVRPYAWIGTVLLIVAFVAVPMPAGHADPVDAARSRLAAARAARAAAQRAANAATARYARLEAEQAVVADGMAATRRRIDAERERHDRLRALVAARAVAAYKGSGRRVPVIGDLDVADAGELIRRRSYLAYANDRSMSEAEAARAAREDLEASLAELEAARRRLDALAAEARRQAQRITAELAAAQRAEREAEAALAAAEAARRAEEQRRRTEEERRRRATLPGTGPPAGPPAGPPPPGPVRPPAPPGTPPSPPPPPRTGLTCPVRGPISFTDDYGASRPGGSWHQGIDIFGPRGAPNVAVVSGRITQKWGPRQGNGVHLWGDDGRLYYYFHLDAYAGGPRRVAQGEVIGYMGDTGATGAVHTHFEIRPGGGGPINPYPTLRAIC